MPDRKEYMRQYRLKKKMQNSNKPTKRAKTAAEHQKEYRARKKAKKLENSEASDSKANIKIFKTAAEYQREYRARKKATFPPKSEDDIKIVKTAAEYQREYRARMKATKAPKSENKIKVVKTAAQYQREYRARMKVKKLEAAAASTAMGIIKVVKTAAERQRECRERKKATKLDAGMSKYKNTIKTVKAAAERQKECREVLRKHILYRDACLGPLLNLGFAGCPPQNSDPCGTPSTKPIDLLNIVSPVHLWSAAASLPWAPAQNFIVPILNNESGETLACTGTEDRTQASPAVAAVKSEPRSPTETDDEEEGSETCFSDVNVKMEDTTLLNPTIKVEVFPDLPIEFELKTDAKNRCTKIDIKQEKETSCSQIEENLIGPLTLTVKSEPSLAADAESYQEEESEAPNISMDVNGSDILQDCLDLSRTSKKHSGKELFLKLKCYGDMGQSRGKPKTVENNCHLDIEICI